MANKHERPRDRASWDARYVEGNLPWDTGKPDQYLVGVIEAYGIEPGKVLEIGCGTGTNSIWLAEQGFEVTGTDIAPTAITKAEAKAADAGVDCNFITGDFLADEVPCAPFEFVFDRGCFHVFDDAQQRSRFAERVGELLAPDGIWHSLIGSTDGPPREVGPPRLSALEVVSGIEPHFEILELRSAVFDSEIFSQPRAWAMVARRRVFYQNTK